MKSGLKCKLLTRLLNSFFPSNGCIVEEGSRIYRSILGYQVKINEGAVIEDSILLGASHHFRRDGKL